VKTGSWLGRDFQGRGLGKEMRAAVLALAFDGLGAEVAETEAFVVSTASAGVSRSLGYEPNGVGRLAPLGEPRDTLRFRMTRANGRGRRLPWRRWRWSYGYSDGRDETQIERPATRRTQ
jgi:RimJ/RimL family protein N-acetyltransferase